MMKEELTWLGGLTHSQVGQLRKYFIFIQTTVFARIHWERKIGEPTWFRVKKISNEDEVCYLYTSASRVARNFYLTVYKKVIYNT